MSMGVNRPPREVWHLHRCLLHWVMQDGTPRLEPTPLGRVYFFLLDHPGHPVDEVGMALIAADLEMERETVHDLFERLVLMGIAWLTREQYICRRRRQRGWWRRIVAWLTMDRSVDE